MSRSLSFYKELVMVVLFSAVLLFFAGGGRDIEIGPPIFLDGRREFIEVGEQHGDLPHVRFAQRLVPGGHAGVPNAGADGVEDVPLRVVGRVGDEIRWWGIKRSGQGRGFAIEASVAEGAVHG